MRSIILLSSASLALSGCAQWTAFNTRAVPATPLTSPAGQLFCQVNTVTGPITVGIVTTAENAVIPSVGGAAGQIAAPVAVLVTNDLAAHVAAECTAAATAVGGLAAVPVVPPSAPVANVAIPPVAAAGAPTAPLSKPAA